MVVTTIWALHRHEMLTYGPNCRCVYVNLSELIREIASLYKSSYKFYGANLAHACNNALNFFFIHFDRKNNGIFFVFEFYIFVTMWCCSQHLRIFQYVMHTHTHTLSIMPKLWFVSIRLLIEPLYDALMPHEYNVQTRKRSVIFDRWRCS